MSVIKVQDLAYVRFSAPDLKRMEQFLQDFGLKPVAATEERLYVRGYGRAPFLHVTDRGEPGYAGLGLLAGDLRALETLSRAENVDIQPLDSPGGGYFIRLADPDGHRVDVVAGQAEADTLALPQSWPWNHAGAYPRASARRLAKGPSHVIRLGHVVLGVTNFRTSERWYKERFGFITSDEVQPNPGVAIGAFMRCDQGAHPCDHHSLFLLEHPDGPKFQHAAFEVQDFDDLMSGGAYLADRAAEHAWGVGRHKLGSQVFDYWCDPWGHEVEHWTDGDRFSADVPPGIASFDDLIGVQWGPSFPGAPQPPK